MYTYNKWFFRYRKNDKTYPRNKTGGGLHFVENKATTVLAVFSSSADSLRSGILSQILGVVLKIIIPTDLEERTYTTHSHELEF